MHRSASSNQADPPGGNPGSLPTAKAAMFAALGEPHRLAIVEQLAASDRTPKELGGRLNLPTNLMAHHLDVLERADLIHRFASSGDKRRRYIRLRRSTVAKLGLSPASLLVNTSLVDTSLVDTSVVDTSVVDDASQNSTTPPSALFVCSHNAARSQLAAALWRRRTGGAASSAGTSPADRIHPGTVAAASRAKLPLPRSKPRLLTDVPEADLVVTVCDRAHEELPADPSWWHWSIPDPIADGSDEAFDYALAALDERISSLPVSN